MSVNLAGLIWEEERPRYGRERATASEFEVEDDVALVVALAVLPGRSDCWPFLGDCLCSCKALASAFS